jgi:hypothetical protein
MAEDYFLIAFSQSNEDECREILAHIDKEKRVKMVLGGPHCTRINNYQAKNLNLFGHELSKIVLLDVINKTISEFRRSSDHPPR